MPLEKKRVDYYHFATEHNPPGPSNININMRMDYDGLAWSRSDHTFESFKQKAITPEVLLAVISFMENHRPRFSPR